MREFINPSKPRRGKRMDDKSIKSEGTERESRATVHLNNYYIFLINWYKMWFLLTNYSIIFAYY